MKKIELFVSKVPDTLERVCEFEEIYCLEDPGNPEWVWCARLAGPNYDCPVVIEMYVDGVLAGTSNGTDNCYFSVQGKALKAKVFMPEGLTPDKCLL